MDCNVGRAHGFGRIAPTAQKLGYHLRELEAAMERYDRIAYSVERTHSGKLQHFQLNVPVDAWTEMTELALPF
ncbi:MAG: hypothetical protein IKM54_00255 [Butyricicoccus sp.]|nr:hypothetical protein [Butyricicoccus sp.]